MRCSNRAAKLRLASGASHTVTPATVVAWSQRWRLY
jgi:hypothetical protein